MDLHNRITELRKQKGWSQSELAEKINVSKSQMIRYENKGVQPPADIINNLAEVLGTIVDYLINGNSDEKAKAALKNSELLQRFREVETLPEREKSVLMKIIGAYIRDASSQGQVNTEPDKPGTGQALSLPMVQFVY